MEETTTVVPLDGFGGGGVADGGGRGAVSIEVVFFGGGGDGGTVPIEVVFMGGGMAVLWQPPLQLVTKMMEVIRVV